MKIQIKTNLQVALIAGSLLVCGAPHPSMAASIIGGQPACPNGVAYYAPSGFQLKFQGYVRTVSYDPDIQAANLTVNYTVTNTAVTPNTVQKYALPLPAILLGQNWVTGTVLTLPPMCTQGSVVVNSVQYQFVYSDGFTSAMQTYSGFNIIPQYIFSPGSIEPAQGQPLNLNMNLPLPTP